MLRVRSAHVHCMWEGLFMLLQELSTNLSTKALVHWQNILFLSVTLSQAIHNTLNCTSWPQRLMCQNQYIQYVSIYKYKQIKYIIDPIHCNRLQQYVSFSNNFTTTVLLWPKICECEKPWEFWAHVDLPHGTSSLYDWCYLRRPSDWSLYEKSVCVCGEGEKGGGGGESCH